MRVRVCDVCKTHIDYSGAAIAMRNIFVRLWRWLMGGLIEFDNEVSKKTRVDMCNKCFSAMCQLIRHPNTIRDFRTELTRSRTQARITARSTYGSTEEEVPPIPQPELGAAASGS